MDTKICTSIEQSKKLLSLGLDPSSADMFYIQMMDEDGCYDEAHIWVAETAEEKLQCEAYKTPAWSVTALLELMPVCIDDDNYFLVIEKDATYLNEPIWRVSYKHYIEEYAIVERNAPLINAAFETVCWLIEQEHIKVNK